MYNSLYTVSTQQYISTMVQYKKLGHITATCFERKRSSSDQWRTLLRYNKVALNVPTDDLILSSSHVPKKTMMKN